jgi:hypothetical protein
VSDIEPAKRACIEALTNAGLSDDIEVAHSDADQAVMEFLHFLGHGDIADLWDSIEKWYA